MKGYTGTCKVKDDSTYIYKGHNLKITGIYLENKNGSGVGVYADGTREYRLCLKGTQFEISHGYTSTVLHDVHLENIELFECIHLPLDADESLEFAVFAKDYEFINESCLNDFLEESKKLSILPIPDLTTLYD